jgi:U3 small nucleolar RNA-associated protein 10
VAAELARLIPDAVLHNIMPIFTFRGASDFQRDDAYSFSVVEKVRGFPNKQEEAEWHFQTVSKIVPVMTKSLKDKAETKLELYNGELRAFGCGVG